jgi:hypothetical protein
MLSSAVDEEVVGGHTHSMLLRQIAGLCFALVIGTSCLGRPSDKTRPKSCLDLLSVYELTRIKSDHETSEEIYPWRAEYGG